MGRALEGWPGGGSVGPLGAVGGPGGWALGVGSPPPGGRPLVRRPGRALLRLLASLWRQGWLPLHPPTPAHHPTPGFCASLTPARPPTPHPPPPQVEYLNSRDATIMGSRNGHAPIYMWYTFTRKGYEGMRKDVERCLRNAHLLKVGGAGGEPVVVGG